MFSMGKLSTSITKPIDRNSVSQRKTRCASNCVQTIDPPAEREFVFELRLGCALPHRGSYSAQRTLLKQLSARH